MEIGNEISQKIRSAIKAKLVDLGAYVDDELPDYIMVMVANKKDQSQMTEDLNLFLGSNTEKFTSWLHALLRKLQSITAGEQKTGSTQNLEEVTSDDLQHTEVKEEMGEAPELDTTPEPEPTEDKAEPEEPVIKLQADDDFDEELADTRQVKVTGKSVAEPVIPPRTEPKQIKPQTVITRKVSKPSSSSREVSSTKETSRTVSSSSRRRKAPTSTVGAVLKHDIEDDDEYDPLRPAIGSVASVVRAPPRRSSVPAKLQANTSLLLKAVSAAQSSIEATTTKREATTNKRPSTTKKQPSAPEKVEKPRDLRDRVGRRTRTSVQSRLGSRRRDEHGDRTGRTEHKDRAGQTEGTKLSQKTPGGKDEHFPVTETRSITVVSRRRLKEKERDQTRAGSQDKDQARGDSQDRVQSPEQSSGSGKQSDSPHREDTPGSPDVLDISLPDDQRLIQFSESESDGGHDNQSDAEGRHDSVPPPDKKGEGRYIEELVESGADLSEYEGDDDDDSHITHKAPFEISVGNAPVSPKFVVTLDGVDPDMLKLEAGCTDAEQMEEGEEYHRAEADYPRDRRDYPSEGRHYSPERKEYHSQGREYPSERREYTSNRREHPSERRDYQGERQGYQEDRREYVRDRRDQERERRQYPSEHRDFQEPQDRGPMNNKRSLSDSFQEDTSECDILEEELAGGKRSKLPERCRFWPACINGDDCQYHHPDTDCINFPRCKFGDKCLYIHPRCKFDPNCTRAGCPFAHSNKRPQPVQAAAPTVIVHPIKVPVYTLKPSYKEYAPPAPPPPSHPKQITCHFFPNCTNMNCPYNHPKPCRFGLSCNQKDSCPFGHPELPSKEKLHWNSKRDSLRTQVL